MLAINQILQERYRIIRPLGHGGMGAVYEAIDERFGEPIALKEIIFDSSNEIQKAIVSRAFEREAKSLAKAKHEAVPYVRDYFSELNRQFLVMELVEGEDLGAMLDKRQSPFAPEDILNWMDQLLDALDYLHNLKPPIIHRDIKPQNLKLSFRHRIKLLDFGVARSTDKSSAFTKQTFVGATLHYSPIEQILRVIDPTFREFILLKHEEKAQKVLNQDTDARCDIYALGGTFYHLLTNHAPVEATKRTLNVWEGKTDPLVNPSEFNPLLSSGISNLLIKALAIERKNRFSSALEMRKALRSVIFEFNPHPSRSGELIAEAKSEDLDILQTLRDYPRENLNVAEKSLTTEISAPEVSKENLQTEISAPEIPRETLQTEIPKEVFQTELPTDLLPPRPAPTQFGEQRTASTQIGEVSFFETSSPATDSGLGQISETIPTGNVSNPELTAQLYSEEILPEEKKEVASEVSSFLHQPIEEKRGNQKLLWVIPIALVGVLAMAGIGGLAWLGMSWGNSGSSNKSDSDGKVSTPSATATATPAVNVAPTVAPAVSAPVAPTATPTSAPMSTPIQGKSETPKTVAVTPNRTPTVAKTPAAATKKTATPRPTPDPNCVFTNSCQ
jgi:serine/threonine protein kinase